MSMNLGVICPKLSRIMLWFLNSFWIIPFCMGAVIWVVETEPVPTIIWHRSNPIFHTEGGAKLSVPIDSNLIIQCPRSNSKEESEYYKIYWVSEEEFHSCIKLPDSKARIFVNCNSPTIKLAFSQLISVFNGIPNSRDFTIGDHYYITTFSTGTKLGLGNEYLGACEEHNMKLNVTVVNAPEPTLPPTNVTRPTRTPRPTHSTKPTTVTATNAPRTTTQRPTPRPTTPNRTTPYRPTDIPDPTDIVINVPDNGNTGVIVADSATALTKNSWALVLCLCLSFLHILNDAHIPWTAR